MPACDGNSCTAPFNSARRSTSSAGGTTTLFKNQRLGAALRECPGPLANRMGISFQRLRHRHRRGRPTRASSHTVCHRSRSRGVGARYILRRTSASSRRHRSSSAPISCMPNNNPPGFTDPLSPSPAGAARWARHKATPSAIQRGTFPRDNCSTGRIKGLTMPFEKYVAIDWSGSRRPRLTPKIQVAEYDPADRTVAIVRSPFANGRWSRAGVFEQMQRWFDEHSVLIRFDFAFAYPYADRGAYFPCGPPPPADDNSGQQWSGSVDQTTISTAGHSTEAQLHRSGTSISATIAEVRTTKSASE